MELNMMIRDQARAGLQTQLAKAVTDGDVEAANKITTELEKLAVATAPKAPPYGDAEIKAAINAKVDWLGVDPRKSAAALRLGKDMDPKKFATAEAFAETLLKAVDEEFKPAKVDNDDDNDEGGTEEDDDKNGEKDGKNGKGDGKAARRKTDGPGDEGNGGSPRRRTSGPWTKLSDAPPEVQTEVKRTADRFVSSNAPKEAREKFIASALASHYTQHQRKAGK